MTVIPLIVSEAESTDPLILSIEQKQNEITQKSKIHKQFFDKFLIPITQLNPVLGAYYYTL